jgi:hypothetical protein
MTTTHRSHRRSPARLITGRLLGLLIALAIVLMYLFVLSRGSWL